MQDTLIQFEVAKLAKEKGFMGRSNFYYTKSKVKIHYSIYHQLHDFKNTAATTQSLLQKWLREKHNIHINIRYEEYFHVSQYKYFHFDINNGSLTDVTNQQDLHGNIMDDSSQDIPGNHLNDEKYSKLIFDKNFAFKTYEACLEFALYEALKLIKNEHK